MKRLAIAFVMFAACGGKSEETKPVETGSGPAGSAEVKPATGSGSATAAGSGSAAPAAGSGSAVAAGDPELPTAEDFEEEATTRITEKNLDTEVKAIEKEIGDN